MLLNALGSPLINDDVVTYAINSLSDKFAHVAELLDIEALFPTLPRFVL